MGRKENGRWCGKCAKCLCVCVLLSAVLEPERVKVEAFGGLDLMRDEGLWPVLCELLGVEGEGEAGAAGGKEGGGKVL